MAKVMHFPLIYDGTSTNIISLPAGQYIDIDTVPLSTTEGNLLRAYDDGLYVSMDNVVSEASDNLLVVQDGRLYVGAMSIGVPVSQDENNLIRAGTDGGAYIDGNDILSNGDVNLLTINPVDGKIILNKETLVRIYCVDNLISNDANNCLVTGLDGRLYVACDDSSASVTAGTGITITSDGVVSVDETWLTTQIEEAGGGGGTSYTSGTGITISSDGVVSVDETWLTTQIEEAGGTSYTSGAGITIQDDSISVDEDWLSTWLEDEGVTGYEAGTGITIQGDAINVDETWLTTMISTISVDPCSFVSSTEGNVLACVDSTLYVAADYGTMG